MSIYGIGDKLKAKRVSKNQLEIEIGGQKAVVFTEDLAALVREELPKDRAAELFSEIEEKFIQKGKARVVVTAQKDIRRGEDVCFTLDVSKYVGDSGGVRTTPGGIIF